MGPRPCGQREHARGGEPAAQAMPFCTLAGKLLGDPLDDE